VKKSVIRKKILKIRKNNKTQYSKIEFKNILKILNKINTKNKIVGGYYPFNYEIDIIEILEKFEKLNYKISLPRINKNSKMDFLLWSTIEPLSINKYGIPEPTSNKIINPSILLIPLVAFDKYNNRIGYGGGYYDRYLMKKKKNKKIITIGLAYSFQKVKKIPTTKHDIKLDFIITDKQS
tara:strand:+ start:76 stop:615 length:540 start_codon:yes stop_codon:yes gene_type:complete